MKQQTSLPESTTDFVGIYRNLLDTQSESVCWTTASISVQENNQLESSLEKTTPQRVFPTENGRLSTPPIFSELQVLRKNGNQCEWLEAARWIKFEEKVEEGGNRWSKPYVGTLDLGSVGQLKQFLLDSSMMLDVEAESMDALIKLIVENLGNSEALSTQERDTLRSLLMQPHRHQFEQGNGKSSKDNLQKQKNMSKDELVLNAKKHKNIRFLRKIPKDAEACNILVGELDSLKKHLTVFVRLKNPKVFHQLTEVPIPTRFVCLLLGLIGSSNYEVGRAVGTLMCDKKFLAYAYRGSETNHLIAGINEFLNSTILIPPTEWDRSIRIEPPITITTASNKMEKTANNVAENLSISDEEHDEARLRAESGLIRSGRFFGGLVDDVKRKAPWYFSDFTDAFNMQCVASFIFLYFACLSPIITFGGLLSHVTEKNIAAIESLASGFICGIGYGLFAGQPLAILGSTGPVLVFESIIYQYCKMQGWDYLTFRFWIGTWIAIILIMLTAFDASAAVCYITRFTEENFATLIAFIFIYEAILNVISIKRSYPLQNTNVSCVCLPPEIDNETISVFVKYDAGVCLANNGTLVGSDCFSPDTSNVFLMSILLFLGTFIVSITLKNFKNAFFFSSCMRQFISDFAVIIAILAMSTLDFFMGVPTQKLEVPAELKPTLPTRDWLIPAFHEQNPMWTIFAAIVPALLGTILIFMDQQITAVIINRKENKLKKGCGYHLDLFILAILIQVCSIMGLPWFVAATVLSLNHVNSLKKESESSAPGEKPQFLGVREQRITQILIFLTIGLSVFLTPLLRRIPMPVLFGVFLYMGVASLRGLQLYERILLLFMPAKYQPDYEYLRQVPIKRVHLFTAIQLTCLISLWIIKSFKQTSIFFPLMLVIMIGIRKMLDHVFTQRELNILDDLMPTAAKVKPQPQGKDNNAFENCV